MTNEARRVLVGLCALAGWGWTVASPAAAQGTTPQVLYACYVRGAGIVYRIKEPGLPPRCHAPSHVEFSWTALVGQRCPTGQVVVGFDMNGGLLCANPSEEPPPPLPGSFEGTWTLSPPLEGECEWSVVGLPGGARASVTEVTTSAVSEGVLSFVLHSHIVIHFIDQALTVGVVDADLPVSVGFDPNTGAFGGSGVGSFPVDQRGTVRLTGTLTASGAVTGSFTGSESFSASVSIAAGMTFRITDLPVPGSLEGVLTCGPMTFVTTGTRS